MRNNKNLTIKRVFYKPLKIVMVYFLILIIIYIWGPMEWRTENPFLLYMFLFLSQGLIYLGYTTTIKKMYKKDQVYSRQNTRLLILNHSLILKCLSVLISINLIMTVLMFIRTTGLSSFSVDHIINNLISGITDPGAQYYSKFDRENNLYGGNILAPLYTLLSPILWPVIPLSIIYYKKLSIINKAFLILTVLLESIRWISNGTNKGIVDLVLIILSVLMLKQLQKKHDRVVELVSKKSKRIRIAIFTVMLIIVGLSVFENNISSRINENYYTVSAITNNTNINEDAPLMKLVPQDIQPLLVYATQYLTQGYYGLSLTLDEPFVPMFGIGNSYFLISNIEQLYDVNIFQYTYQSRIQFKGWDPLLNWSSIYSWLANDFSYFGVLLLMFFLGKYFAIVYYKSLVYKDPITSVLFSLLLICFFYFPANNQILSTPSMFMSFLGLNLLWFYKINTKRKGKMEN